MSEQGDPARPDNEHPVSSTETDEASEERAETEEEPEESIADGIRRYMEEGPFIPHVFIAGGRMLRRTPGPLSPVRPADTRPASPPPRAPR
jgi:hypothetical protein